MKKKLFIFLTFWMIFCYSVSSAASYTLPEKLHNQLAIGSGFKGTFTVSAEGELASVPFLKAVSGAEFSLRGMQSGNDLHYYIFQSDENENQTGLTELYRTEDRYYLRSDMVQGRVIAIPAWDQFLDNQFPAKGENPTISSALIGFISLSNTDREKWDNVISRYEDNLEFWLAEFTMEAEVVNMEDGVSALNFTYHIPGEAVQNKILSLFESFGSDTELQAILDKIMTPEQKTVYVNNQYGYYYHDLLNSLDFSQGVTLTKTISSLGTVYSSVIDLPLDQRLTGYSHLSVVQKDGIVNYQFSGDSGILSFAFPVDADLQSEESTFYFKRLSKDNLKTGWEGNVSVRADLRKSIQTYEDDEERSHQEEHYSIVIEAYEDEDTSDYEIPPFEKTQIDLILHYHSKYSQNSATTLDIQMNMSRPSSGLNFTGTFKSAAPWLFMPFDISNAEEIKASDFSPVVSYLTDWVSNAPSIIRYGDQTTGSSPATFAPEATALPTPIPVYEDEDNGSAEAETAPMDDLPDETDSDVDLSADDDGSADSGD